MVSTMFAFGQRGGYYFETKSKWHFGKLPDKLAKLFSTTGAERIESCHHVALGAGESFLVSYKGRDGMDRIDAVGIPESLETWLFEKNDAGNYTRHFSKIRVTFGPYNKSYFATDGLFSHWLNLPKGLDDALKGYRSDPFNDQPRIVALGVDDNYLLITKNHAAAWSLGSYCQLGELIDESREPSKDFFENIEDLYLHPYRLETRVIKNKNGRLSATNLPEHTERAFEAIKIAVEADTVAELKQLGALETKEVMGAIFLLQQILDTHQRMHAMGDAKTLKAQLLYLKQQIELQGLAMLFREQSDLIQINQAINTMNAIISAL